MIVSNVKFRITIFFILAVHSTLLLYSANVHSPTRDELPHIVSGLSHLQTGDFSHYRVNPPLARMIAALPIFLFDDSAQQWPNLYSIPGDLGRAEFHTANRFVDTLGLRTFNWITNGRVASIPFSVIAALAIFRWASFMYGRHAGLLAITLWCTSPFVLGFGAIVTPDVPSAAFGAIALYSFTRWTQSPSLSSSLAAGAFLGLALLSKSTWIILPPLYLALLLGQRLAKRLRSHPSTRVFPRERILLRETTVIMLVGWLVFCSGFMFDGMFQRLGEFPFQSKLLAGTTSESTQYGNRFRGTALHNIPIPIPRQFVLGFDHHKWDVEPGRKFAYLHGCLRKEGWWYYYFYALGVKCTLGGLALFVCSCTVRLCISKKPIHFAEWVIIATTLCVLAMLSTHTGLNKHSRYLIPVLPPLIVWSSQLVSQASQLSSSIVAWACVAAAAFSSLLAFPHNMSYFNELVGSENGRYHMSNSNVDWGQDMYFLKREMDRRGWRKIGLVCRASYAPQILGIDFFLPPLGTATEGGYSLDLLSELRPGPYAISTCLLSGYPYAVPGEDRRFHPVQPGAYSYFDKFKPIGRVGYSLILFELTAEDIQSLKEENSPETQL